MKLSLLCTFLSYMILSCSTMSTKTSMPTTESSISKIELSKTTRGNQRIVEFSQNGIEISGTVRSSMELSSDDWGALSSLASGLKLEDLEKYDAPSSGHASDIKKATVLSIISNGVTYRTQTFDEGNPPSELAELYNHLESLVNQ